MIRLIASFIVLTLASPSLFADPAAADPEPRIDRVDTKQVASNSDPSVVVSKQPVSKQAAAFEQLVQEIAEVQQAYGQWGMKRQIKIYATIAVDPKVDRSRSIDWTKQIPIRVLTDEFLHSGERFRMERIEPKGEEMQFMFDGTIARRRDRFRTSNSPRPSRYNAFEKNQAPLLPHGILVDFFYSRYMEWLTQPTTGKLFQRGKTIGTSTVEATEYGGHPCWKVVWKSINNDDLEVATGCLAYLARDRSLIPIHQEFDTPANESYRESWTIDTDEFQLEPSTGLWYPGIVTASRQWGSDLQVARVTFQPDTRYDEPSIYSNARAISPDHANPPKSIVSSFTPAALLADANGVAAQSMTLRQAFQTRIPGVRKSGIAFSMLLVVFLVYLNSSSKGRAFRAFLDRHRIVLGVTGIVLTVGIGYLCTLPPGWTTYGLSMIFVGLFGVLWIVVSILMLGNKQVSIRMALFAAACTALCFGGYSKGVKRMQTRQRMIQDVRDEGGQVTIGLWRLDEDGLFLPNGLRNVFGEAWSGRASQATIAHEAFTADNVENWCLEEVKWLGIASRHPEPFEINSHALSKIGDKNFLWTLHVEGGYLDGKALSEAARFRNMIDLHYDCQHRRVAKEIAMIPDLERVWLTNAIVDDDLIDALEGIKNLEYVTLITPRFGTFNRPHPKLAVDGIEVQYGKLTPTAFNTLGQLSSSLYFVDCNVSIPQSTDVVLPLTKALSFQTSDISDSALLKLTDSPKLAAVDLSGTDVSINGIEAFSLLRPQVYLTLE